MTTIKDLTRRIEALTAPDGSRIHICVCYPVYSGEADYRTIEEARRAYRQEHRVRENDIFICLSGVAAGADAVLGYNITGHVRRS